MSSTSDGIIRHRQSCVCYHFLKHTEFPSPLWHTQAQKTQFCRKTRPIILLKPAKNASYWIIIIVQLINPQCETLAFISNRWLGQPPWLWYRCLTCIKCQGFATPRKGRCVASPCIMSDISENRVCVFSLAGCECCFTENGNLWNRWTRDWTVCFLFPVGLSNFSSPQEKSCKS